MFRKFSVACSDAMGSAWAFVLAAVVIVVWGASGPLFSFSDTWQLVINTGTTILTFLAVFLIQNTQNRDAKAIHLKLDELIRSIHGARNGLVALEDMPDEEMKKIADEFQQLHEGVHGVTPVKANGKVSSQKPRGTRAAGTNPRAGGSRGAKTTNGSRQR
jgi:low affinity Fe/Cu permease